jgi:hypothetical protein
VVTGTESTRRELLAGLLTVFVRAGAGEVAAADVITWVECSVDDVFAAEASADAELSG